MPPPRQRRRLTTKTADDNTPWPSSPGWQQHRVRVGAETTKTMATATAAAAAEKLEKDESMETSCGWSMHPPSSSGPVQQRQQFRRGSEGGRKEGRNERNGRNGRREEETKSLRWPDAMANTDDRRTNRRTLVMCHAVPCPSYRKRRTTTTTVCDSALLFVLFFFSPFFFCKVFSACLHMPPTRLVSRLYTRLLP